MNKIIILLLSIFLLFGCSATQVVDFDDNELAVIISNKANEYFEKRNYNMAIKTYQVIIDRFDPVEHESDVAWAYYEIGFCYYYKKKYQDAINYFNIVLQNFTTAAPRILASIVLEDIYEIKPRLMPTIIIEEEIDNNNTTEKRIIDDTIIN